MSSYIYTSDVQTIETLQYSYKYVIFNRTSNLSNYLIYSIVITDPLANNQISIEKQRNKMGSQLIKFISQLKTLQIHIFYILESLDFELNVQMPFVSYQNDDNKTSYWIGRALLNHAKHFILHIVVQLTASCLWHNYFLNFQSISKNYHFKQH